MHDVIQLTHRSAPRCPIRLTTYTFNADDRPRRVDGQSRRARPAEMIARVDLDRRAPRGRRARRAHAGDRLPRPCELAGGPVAAQGRVPAGHGLVQDPRRAQPHRGARPPRRGGPGRRRAPATTRAPSPTPRACAGVACEVFMPRDAPVSKVAGGRSARRARAARRRLGRRGARAGAAPRAARPAPPFVHPFDDLDVIAGQATLGLELIEDVPDLARVIVPVGGGGLASGDRASRCAAAASRPS